MQGARDSDLAPFAHMEGTMQIGDKVQVLGTVRDIVDKSVLVLTEDSMGQREYWFLAEHVTVVEAAPPPVAEQLPAEPEEPTHPARPSTQPVRPVVTPVRK